MVEKKSLIIKLIISRCIKNKIFSNKPEIIYIIILIQKTAPMAELVDATDSKSVELRFMSVRVGLGVPLSELNLII